LIHSVDSKSEISVDFTSIPNFLFITFHRVEEESNVLFHIIVNHVIVVFHQIFSSDFTSAETTAFGIGLNNLFFNYCTQEIECSNDQKEVRLVKVMDEINPVMLRIWHVIVMRGFSHFIEEDGSVAVSPVPEKEHHNGCVLHVL